LETTDIQERYLPNVGMQPINTDINPLQHKSNENNWFKAYTQNIEGYFYAPETGK